MSRKFFIKNISVLRKTMLLVASRFLTKEEDAEDVVQEVLLKLWTMKDRLSDIENIEGYATQMTKNLSLDRLRLQKHTEDITDSISFNYSTGIEKQLEHREAIDVIEVIIERLPTLQQMIIKMHDIEEYDTLEIAKITGSSADAIRMNLSRARKKVREMYLYYLNHEKR